MLKKRIKYEGFDENVYEEEFYFNLTKAELAEMEITAEGGKGFEQAVRGIIAGGDGRKIMDLFTTILQMSYGVRSADGKRFTKQPEGWTAFKESNAYSELVMEMLTSPTKMAEFVAAIVPKDLSEQVRSNAITASAQGLGPKFEAVDEVRTEHPLATVSPIDRAVAPRPNPIEIIKSLTPAGDEGDLLRGIHHPSDPAGYSTDELIAMTDEQFRVVMRYFQGKNVPKHILRVAVHRS